MCVRTWISAVSLAAFLVEVFLEDEECSLNQSLIDQRYGVAYEGQSKQEILLKHLANVEHWRNTGRLEEE